MWGLIEVDPFFVKNQNFDKNTSTVISSICQIEIRGSVVNYGEANWCDQKQIGLKHKGDVKLKRLIIKGTKL